MTLPSLLFSLLVALAIGSLYHLIRGGGFWRLLFYLFLSVTGFAIGHLIGVWRGWFLFTFGAVNLGLSAAGSVLVLLFGDWLSRIEVNSESTV